jgi:hypothetical protein
MSGTVSYLFYAIDKPLTAAQRAQVAKLSRRVQPTARSAEFSYQVEGYDIPGGYEPLMAKYYDVVVRQDYDLWTLGLAFPYTAALYQALAPFVCDAGDGIGVFLEKLGAGRTTARKVARPTQLLAEFAGFLDYDAADALSGLPELPWESAAMDEEDEEEDEDDWNGEWEYRSDDDEGNTLEATLARLAYRIRADALHGDYRAFYLVWRKFTPARERKAAAPTEPPRLKRLPAHLRSLTKLLQPEP